MKVRVVKKNWFTLVEVMLVTSAFAMIVVWIILAINRAFVFIDNTRLSVRATNFAREWMEMMYNIRDTNRRRQSWDRDKYWINTGKPNDEGWLDDANFYEEWIYVLKTWSDAGGNVYLYAKHLGSTYNLGSSGNQKEFYWNDGFWDDNYSLARDEAKLSFDGTYSYYEWDEEEWKDILKEWDIDDVLVWDWLEFYRIVRVFGIYKKGGNNGDNPWPNDSVSDTEKRDWTPSEMRFCVKVFYASQWKHATELCSIMTNFME